MASSVKSRNTQLQSTIDVIFLEISTISPHIVTLDSVKKLAEALEKNQCFDTGHPKGGTRLDIFEDIKKKMTMNKESRATLITWLVNFAGSCKYCEIHIFSQNITVFSLKYANFQTSGSGKSEYLI